MIDLNLRNENLTRLPHLLHNLKCTKSNLTPLYTLNPGNLNYIYVNYIYVNYIYVNGMHFSVFSASYERLNRELSRLVEKSVTILCRTWFDIGFTAEQQGARAGVVLLHVGNLLEEMADEEQSLHARLLDNIIKYRVDVDQLCSQLDIPNFEVLHPSS